MPLDIFDKNLPVNPTTNKPWPNVQYFKVNNLQPEEVIDRLNQILGKGAYALVRQNSTIWFLLSDRELTPQELQAFSKPSHWGDVSKTTTRPLGSPTGSDVSLNSSKEEETRAQGGGYPATAHGEGGGDGRFHAEPESTVQGATDVSEQPQAAAIQHNIIHPPTGFRAPTRKGTGSSLRENVRRRLSWFWKNNNSSNNRNNNNRVAEYLGEDVNRAVPRSMRGAESIHHANTPTTPTPRGELLV